MLKWASDSQLLENEKKQPVTQQSKESEMYDLSDLPIKRSIVPMSFINRCINSDLEYCIKQDADKKIILVHKQTNKPYKKPESPIQQVVPLQCSDLDMDMSPMNNLLDDFDKMSFNQKEPIYK